MASRGAGQGYAKGKYAVGECARSGRKMLLRHMIADGYYPNLIVDPAYYEPKHPQEALPSVKDPTALYRPAPERDRSGSVVRLGRGLGPSEDDFGSISSTGPIAFGFQIGAPTIEIT